MDAIVINATVAGTTLTDSSVDHLNSNFSSISPLRFSHIEETLSQNENNKNVSALIIELLHREIGGKLAP